MIKMDTPPRLLINSSAVAKFPKIGVGCIMAHRGCTPVMHPQAAGCKLEHQGRETGSVMAGACIKVNKK